jgi:hypothetical protein
MKIKNNKMEMEISDESRKKGRKKISMTRKKMSMTREGR